MIAVGYFTVHNWDKRFWQWIFCNFSLKIEANYNSSSNFIFVSGILLIGTNSEINPPILIDIDRLYKIDSGKTKEYHPRNSPKASNAKPNDTKIAPFFLLSKYDMKVSIAPYASKINETDLKIFSMCIDETKNKGKIPTDLK